jgi:SAM-dependent methyltransferase
VANYQPFTPDPETLARRMASRAAEQDVTPLAAGPRRSRMPAQVPATLEGITSLRDSAFIEAAYRLLLGRDADDASLQRFVGALRSGSLDKVDILGDLRYSDEGRHRGVDIPGLEWRYRIRRLGRQPGIGWVVRWLLAFGRLPALTRTVQRQQAEIEHGSVAAEEHVDAIEALAAELSEARTRLQTAESALAELFEVARATSATLTDLTGRLDTTEQTFETRHQQLSAANARLVQQLHELSTRPVSAAAATPAPIVQTVARAEGERDLDDWYLAFEDQFRGTREETKRAQEVYLDYVTAAGAGTVNAPILDIGCGRGEWLELLQEHGAMASGVDLNEAMVEENRKRGFKVTYGDALSYLAALPAGSLGMVTGFHIIEHIRFDLLVKLFDECHRALRPGGCILFETPNPENLVVGAYTFYFDPTHRHPLPPKMIDFVVRARGYAEVDILRLHPRQEEGIDQVLLDKWFRGPADYAVIGWKERRGTGQA